MATTTPGPARMIPLPAWRTVLRVLGGPVLLWGWQETGFIAAGVPLAVPTVWAAVLMPKLLLIGAVLVLGVLLGLLPLLTRLQRSRFRALLGLDIPEIPGPDQPLRGRQRLRVLRAESTWRQLAYHLLAGPLVAAFAVLVLAGWTVGLVLSTVYAWTVLAPTGSLVVNEGGRSLLWMTVLGVLLLWTLPWAALLVRQLDTRAAAALLGPNRARELQRRVESLAESRSEVVDAADAERRRIERDLHDGAQQRLVSMAMNLGLARRMLRGLPVDEQAPRAMEVIEEAHREAQAAIAELRDLVRGLHPVVLEDRGLDAALSGITARAPLPVRLTVELQQRAAPAVEAVAYFVVSEALANIAKHARASRSEVSVRQSGPRIVITVFDDGIGGADPARGTGLSGLRQRAASVDGTLAVSSPSGGPTTLTVELPCVL
ncbi:sensor histidine kinase [Streptacidiphilus carbonis]|jgi:signal transduction histidine kinase|uniref:sensor histidine kinase n=1 Tax=Streptacidiphilus carbonis TaxID=105422 RepID=UPI000AB34607|nr:histidine kinase [Streptacidiphilus carbonis]